MRTNNIHYNLTFAGRMVILLSIIVVYLVASWLKHSYDMNQQLEQQFCVRRLKERNLPHIWIEMGPPRTATTLQVKAMMLGGILLCGKPSVTLGMWGGRRASPAVLQNMNNRSNIVIFKTHDLHVYQNISRISRTPYGIFRTRSRRMEKLHPHFIPPTREVIAKYNGRVIYTQEYDNDRVKLQLKTILMEYLNIFQLENKELEDAYIRWMELWSIRRICCGRQMSAEWRKILHKLYPGRRGRGTARTPTNLTASSSTGTGSHQGGLMSSYKGKRIRPASRAIIGAVAAASSSSSSSASATASASLKPPAPVASSTITTDEGEEEMEKEMEKPDMSAGFAEPEPPSAVPQLLAVVDSSRSAPINAKSLGSTISNSNRNSNGPSNNKNNNHNNNNNNNNNNVEQADYRHRHRHRRRISGTPHKYKWKGKSQPHMCEQHDFKAIEQQMVDIETQIFGWSKPDTIIGDCDCSIRVTVLHHLEFNDKSYLTEYKCGLNQELIMPTAAIGQQKAKIRQ